MLKNSFKLEINNFNYNPVEGGGKTFERIGWNKNATTKLCVIILCHLSDRCLVCGVGKAGKSDTTSTNMIGRMYSMYGKFGHIYIFSVQTMLQRTKTRDNAWIQLCNDDNQQTNKNSNNKRSCIAVMVAERPLQNRRKMRRCAEPRGT